MPQTQRTCCSLLPSVGACYDTNLQQMARSWNRDAGATNEEILVNKVKKCGERKLERRGGRRQSCRASSSSSRTLNASAILLLLRPSLACTLPYHPLPLRNAKHQMPSVACHRLHRHFEASHRPADHLLPKRTVPGFGAAAADLQVWTHRCHASVGWQRRVRPRATGPNGWLAGKSIK